MNADAGTPYLTTAEVAAILRISANYVSRQCANGNLRATKLGKEWRIHRDAVTEFMTPGERPSARFYPLRGRTRAR